MNDLKQNQSKNLVTYFATVLEFFFHYNEFEFVTKQMTILSQVSKLFYLQHKRNSSRYTYDLDFNIFGEKIKHFYDYVSKTDLNIPRIKLSITANLDRLDETDINQRSKKIKVEPTHTNRANDIHDRFIIPSQCRNIDLTYDAENMKNNGIDIFYVNVEHAVDNFRITNCSMRDNTGMTIKITGNGSVRRLETDRFAGVTADLSISTRYRIIDTPNSYNITDISHGINLQEIKCDKLVLSTIPTYNFSDFTELTTLTISEISPFMIGHTFPNSLQNLIVTNKHIVHTLILFMFPEDDKFMLTTLNLGTIRVIDLHFVIQKTRKLYLYNLIEDDDQHGSFVYNDVYSQLLENIIVHSNFDTLVIKHNYVRRAIIDLSITKMEMLSIESSLIVQLPTHCNEIIFLDKKISSHLLDLKTPIFLKKLSVYNSTIFNSMRGLSKDLIDITLHIMDIMIVIPEYLQNLTLTVDSVIQNNIPFYLLPDSFYKLEICINDYNFLAYFNRLHQLTILHLDVSFKHGEYIFNNPPNLAKLQVLQNFSHNSFSKNFEEEEDDDDDDDYYNMGDIMIFVKNYQKLACIVYGETVQIYSPRYSGYYIMV